MPANEPASLGQVKVVRDTDKALLVHVEDLEKSIWVPKSVIHEDSEIVSDSEPESDGELVVKEWWARARSLV